MLVWCPRGSPIEQSSWSELRSVCWSISPGSMLIFKASQRIGARSASIFKAERASTDTRMSVHGRIDDRSLLDSTAGSHQLLDTSPIFRWNVASRFGWSIRGSSRDQLYSTAIINLCVSPECHSAALEWSDAPVDLGFCCAADLRPSSLAGYPRSTSRGDAQWSSNQCRVRTGQPNTRTEHLTILQGTLHNGPTAKYLALQEFVYTARVRANVAGHAVLRHGPPLCTKTRGKLAILVISTGRDHIGRCVTMTSTFPDASGLCGT